MLKKIDPTLLGLSQHTKIVKNDNEQYHIIKNRKSRIVMNDGKLIVKQAKQIRKHFGAVDVLLITNAPVCSKTTIFLEKHHIRINHPV